MRTTVKVLLLLIFMLSIIGIILINTGQHATPSSTQIGYEYCGGGGIIPLSSLGNGVDYGGPCRGRSIYSNTTTGRYDINLAVSDAILGTVAAVSLVLTVIILFEKNRSTKASKRKSK